MSKKIFLFFLFFIVILTSCVVKEDDMLNITNAPDYLLIDETHKLEFNSKANLSEDDVYWTSSNPEICSVNNGLLYGVSEGTVTISVVLKSDESNFAFIFITVLKEYAEIMPSKIEFLKDSIDITLDTEVDLEYKFIPANTTKKEVVFNSSNPNVANFVYTGKLKALSIGVTVITIYSNYNQNVYDTITVNVVASSNIVDLTIYSLNDFHGMIFETSSGVGASKISKYLKDNTDDKTILISSGDMFQGSAVSSMSRGSAVVDFMNYNNFDVMSIGNHEFDWGIEETIKFNDQNLSNGEANFPIIVSNVTDLRTNQLASWATPYAVFEKAGVKIGVVGVIGQTQESDILRTYVLNYDFTDELTAIKKYTKILRSEEKCDIVIVSAHLDTSFINDAIANLTGDYYVDAVINGHTHQQYYGEIYRSGSAPLPYIQSGSYGSYIGRINLAYDKSSKKVVDTDVINIKTKDVCFIEDQQVNQIISNYNNFIEIANEELGLSGEYINQSLGGLWSANVICEYFDADMGIVNTGGIRGAGFPIYENSMITYGDIFEIMPFENMVRYVYLTGDQIINELLAYSSSYFISTNVNPSNNTINDIKIDRKKYYKVATIDYLFEKTDRPFLYGKDRFDSDVLFRDILAQAVKNCVSENGKFYCLG